MNIFEFVVLTVVVTAFLYIVAKIAELIYP